MRVHHTIPAARPTVVGGIVRCVMAVLALFLVSPATTALADAAGPTDYRSAIVSIDPPTPTIHPSIIGGDSFLLLRVDRGVSVQVTGYEGEPYVQFLPDGTVQENHASISYWSSQSRLGGAVPDDAPSTGPPVWVGVGSDGTYAWHDHRIHWMSADRPLGKQPGDVVLQAEVPLVVDGVSVQLTIQSTWLRAPSSVPAWAGALLGALVAVGAFIRPRLWTALAVLDLAVLAAVVGFWQYFSLPAETGPSVLWFALPAVAVAAAVALVVTTTRRAQLAALALQLLIGVNLAWWAWSRRSGLERALLPTNAPGWLDRAATGAALSCGVFLALLSFQRLVRLIVSPQRVLLPADHPFTSAS